MKRRSLTEAVGLVAPGAGGELRERADDAVPRRTVPVALGAIRCEDRLRATDPREVAAIAASLAEVGLQQPVVLRPDRRDPGAFSVIDGAHRLGAAERLGWAKIEALIVDLPPDETRLIEIDANLARAELTPLDRARFLKVRKEIYERLHPETGHGRSKVANVATFDSDGAEDGKVANVATLSGGRVSFADDAARRTGMSARTVRRAAKIGKGLAADVVDALAGTAIAERQRDLERLARMSEADQRRLAAGIEPAETLDDVLRREAGFRIPEELAAFAERDLQRIKRMPEADRQIVVERFRSAPAKNLGELLGGDLVPSEKRRLNALKCAWAEAGEPERAAFSAWTIRAPGTEPQTTGRGEKDGA